MTDKRCVCISLAELCDRRHRHRGGDLLDGNRLQVPPGACSRLSFELKTEPIILESLSSETYGTNEQTISQFKQAEGESEEDDIPYGFGFFHLVFAMGAMYFAMIFVGWNASHTMER